jgi:hypothetical protein
MPLTDTAIRNAKPERAAHTHLLTVEVCRYSDPT